MGPLNYILIVVYGRNNIVCIISGISLFKHTEQVTYK